MVKLVYMLKTNDDVLRETGLVLDELKIYEVESHSDEEWV